MSDNIDDGYFIRCTCGFEGLHIEKDSYDGDINFSLWYYGKQDLGLKHKLEWIWNIIKGKPYSDAIIVNPERIPQIIEILNGMKE